MLKKIDYDENLTQFDLTKTAPCDDRLITKVTLDDYDWMKYMFETWFPTKEQGFLYIKITYSGFIQSDMEVEQTINGKKYNHTIRFDTELFKNFIKDFLTKHVAQWDNSYAFSGEKEAVEFYNQILDNILEYKVEEVEE